MFALESSIALEQPDFREYMGKVSAAIASACVAAHPHGVWKGELYFPASDESLAAFTGALRQQLGCPKPPIREALSNGNTKITFVVGKQAGYIELEPLGMGSGRVYRVTSHAPIEWR
jgi:hypothetical protein